MWGGSFHKVPQDFEFPSVNLFVGWKLWWEGHPHLGVPPFRELSNHDVGELRKRRTLSDWKTVFSHFEEWLKQNRPLVYIGTPSAEQVEAMFTALKEYILSFETPKKRKRRDGHIKVMTAVKTVRRINQTEER
jgi:hypothetical protein